MSSSRTDTGGVDVTMPQMGVSVAEGAVVAWHKQVGDWVEEEETLCEISTDKIDIDVPAPAAGRLAEILVELEQTVPVGTVIARIATDARAGEPHPDERLDEEPPALAPPAPAVVDEQASLPEQRDSRTRSSPVVRRIATSAGIDLADVAGSGRGGRVRKQDVLAYIAQRAGGNGGQAGDVDAPLHIDSPYREPGSSAAVAPAAHDDGARLSRMRRSIAEHMVRSLQTAAHCTSIGEADMSAIEAARATLRLTYLPFVARCAVDALRAHPELNATLEGEQLTLHRSINLGIAVSLGADGLIVPVVHDAQELSHEGLARRIAELAQRARAGALQPDDVSGGTFTITNPGGYGTLASTPIINQPQVAILDLEAVVKRVVVVDDGAGGDAVAIRPMANLCLSWDHRALDGALAAQFLATLRARIERWEAS